MFSTWPRLQQWWQCNELSYDEQNDWHSLHPLWVQFVDYTIRENAVKVCWVQSGHQILDQQLIGPKEESEEEDKTAAYEDKLTFLDAMKGLEMERQYMFQFDMEDKL